MSATTPTAATPTYTPGPWRALRRGMGQSIVGADGAAVASTGNSQRYPGEKAANARLLAAAPELLAACEGLLAALAYYYNLSDLPTEVVEAEEAARLAVRKATNGRSA